MDFAKAGPSGVKIMTKKELFDIMQQQNELNINEKLEFLENFLLNFEPYSEEQKVEIKHKFSHLKFEMKHRWVAAHKKEEYFLKNNHDWLQGTYELPRVATRPGRPSKTFGESCERSKRRKTENLRSSTGSDELIFATQVQLQTEGKRQVSKILKEITVSPTRAHKYQQAYTKSMQGGKPTQLTPIQALAMFVEAELSRTQYEVIRETNKQLYPCYSIIQRAKRECYPGKGYNVTSTCAEITLQEVINHTVTQLFTYLEEVLQTLSEEEGNSLMMIYKWGCDGSQQAQFKQKFENDSDSDAHIFLSSFVPLQLICDVNEKRIIWQNPIPSSPRYCRPIRIRFVKESVDITNDEIQYIENSADQLEPTTVILAQRTYFVKHTLTLTMIDAKVCNAATQTRSTMRCYVCGAISKDFNDLSKMKEVNEESLRFGLSILHARIRFFESLLHLAYKLPVKKWQLREESDKDIVKQRKSEIQKAFRDKMGLIVDIPKPGFGNTNDGNTSRRFFASPDLASEITGLDYNLIYRIKVILETISSGHRIHIDKFKEFTLDTAKLYVELYGWHPMTPTMHKILVHGAVIVQTALLPIGQLSEEAQEARNKHFRAYRQNYARKSSREACNLDVLNRLLLTSDPVITGLRPIPKKRSKPFSKETIDMLLPPKDCSIPDEEQECEEEEEEKEEEEHFSSDEEPWLPSSPE